PGTPPAFVGGGWGWCRACRRPAGSIACWAPWARERRATTTSGPASAGPAGSSASVGTLAEDERELLDASEGRGADSPLAEVAGQVVGEAVDRVDLLRRDHLHRLDQLLEVAVVGEREGHVGPEKGAEVAVLGPAGDQRAAVA